MNYSVEIADIPNELEHIVALWKRNMPLDKDLDFDQIKEKCFWFYVDNPYGPCKLWLLRKTDTKDVIGSIGVSFRKYKIESEYFVFGLAQNFAIEKKYRTLGPALMLIRETCKASYNESMVIYGAPGGAAVVPFKRTGSVDIGKISRYVKVLNYEKYIKKKINNRVIVKIASICANTIFRIKSKEYWIRLQKEWSTMHVDEFDHKFNKIWDTVKDEFPVMEERDNVYLTWRYITCPNQKFHIYIMKEKTTDRLLAYIVYKFEEENTVQIMDFLSESIDSHLYHLLLDFIRLMRKNGVDSIVIRFMGTKKVTDMFEKAGFSLRLKLRAFMFNFCKANKRIIELFKNEDNLYFTSGDDND